MLHVVRNPWSAYADTKKRPVPLSLENYMLGWTLTQYYALLFRDKFPNRVHIVRAEDVMGSSSEALGTVCEKLGCYFSESLKTASFNGIELGEVYPWGTIRQATPKKTALPRRSYQMQNVKKSEVARGNTWTPLTTRILSRDIDCLEPV